MTNDELADAFAAAFAELHDKIDALDEGPAKRKAARLARVAHGAMDALKELASDEGEIQPFSGGEPKDNIPE